MFYVLEGYAKDAKTASRTFLLVPNDPEDPSKKTSWTYAEAYDTILKYAKWLKDRQNVQKNELIAMDFTNKPQFIWVWFALWSLGAIPAFINHNLRDKAFTHCVRVSTARLLLVDPQIREVFNEATRAALGPDEKGQAVESVIIEPEMEEEILAQTPYRAPDEARSGAKITDTSLLIYTSGTTGLPKAANVSWAKPISGVKLFSTLLGLKPTDRYLTALPLYHSSGSLLGVLQVLGPGCTVSGYPAMVKYVVYADTCLTVCCLSQILATYIHAPRIRNESRRYTLHWRNVQVPRVESANTLGSRTQCPFRLRQRYANGRLAAIQRQVQHWHHYRILWCHRRNRSKLCPQ